ncbi:MAG: 2-phosphosulfolactate phosphatase [Deltaproteobacteria bacterium]|nr:2-phosphosulfolactate phosphatase [Deltaproteobacteria bacterium]
MAKLHVLMKKEELEEHRLPGKVVVVLDVLFATSSIAAALHHGATEVVPALDAGAARAEAARRPPGSCVLAGELGSDLLPGFGAPTPLALLGQGITGRSLIYSTTNGTVALARATSAARVYAASLLNGRAVVEHLQREAGGGSVLLVCSGSAGTFNLEDFYGAGYLVSLLRERSPGHELSDAAQAALAVHERTDPLACLSQSRVGRTMLDRGLADEVAFAARKDALPVVPLLSGGALRRA